MHVDRDASAHREGAPAEVKTLFRAVPWWALILAFVLSAYHLNRVWIAQAQTPTDWVFTGNPSVSPDMMQYRVWSRQTLSEGWIVTNALTSEPNRPHIPVLLYYLTGRVSQWTGVPVPFVHAYLGVPAVFALVLLVCVFVRHFLGTSRRTIPVSLAIFLGGGLGGYLGLAERHRLLGWFPVLQRHLVEARQLVPLLDDYRQHYLIRALNHTHFSVIWLLATIAMVVFYFGLRTRPRRIWIGASGLLWALATVVHVYTGVTLAVAAVVVGILLARRGLLTREGGWLILTQVAAVAGVAIWIATMFRSSGLPTPTWREPLILPSTLLLGFPLQLGLLAWGGPRLWRQGGFDSVFLLGWVLGCLLVTLSAPFNPYPSRGTMTLLVPLTIVAAFVAFDRIPRFRVGHIMVAVVLLAGTPLLILSERVRGGGFRTDRPARFLGQDHRLILSEIAAAPDSAVLLSRPQEALWLAPVFPGRNYVAHFFLTVDYERKVSEVERLFAGEEGEPVRFVQDRGVDYVYVGAADQPQRFRTLPGWTVLSETPTGWLFKVAADPVVAP